MICQWFWADSFELLYTQVITPMCTDLRFPLAISMLPVTVLFTDPSHIIRVAWRIKIHHSHTAVDRRIKIVQLEQVFEPYRMLFKEMKGRKKQ